MTDILERAKAAIAEAQSCGHTRYEELSSNALDELLPDAITEVERLQDLIDSPPEEADWLHDDARLCGEITTGVVQIARKWHSAYRKAQNSNLMRAKEVERLEATFLEAKRCPTCNGAGKLIDVVISRNLGRVESERVCPLCEGKWEEKARETLERIKEGGKDDY